MSRLLAGLAVFVLFAAAVPTAEAQTGKLTGVVTDAQSGVPLEGAQVILQGTGISALTGSNGRYFLVNIPPGTYIAMVRRIGYSSAEVRNVFIQIDVTRNVDVELTPTGAIGVEEIVVSAEAEPLVQPGVTGTGTNIRAEEIEALPVTSIQGVLALQQGFVAVPQNTDIISFSESRRNSITPIRIRGGRGGETLSLIDGVPVNNFVFGGPAFDITTEAVEQVDFQRGGFEPQYGNALSGIINIATREGGTNLAGAFSYQTSAVGGALGNTPDELSDYDLFQGYLSGPIPGTSQRLRFMAAGRVQNGADRVLKFDDDVNRGAGPLPGRDPNLANPDFRDLFPGWRAFGYNNVRDLTGKLTFYVTPTAKLSVSGIRYEGQRLPFDFGWLLMGFYPLNTPGVQNLEDSLDVGIYGGTGLIQQPSATGGQGGPHDVVQGSIYAERTLYSAKWDHTMGRWAYQARAGRFDQRRTTCSVWQGVCLGRKLADLNFGEVSFVANGITNSATDGTETIFGGEHMVTTSAGLNVQGQATDHHQLQFGGSFTHHDVAFEEWVNVGTNETFVIPKYYAAKPWEAAAFVQDKIEYDFLVVKLGMRFDWGRAGGTFFANPRDPTNGTTAKEICDANPDRYTTIDPGTGLPVSGFLACGLDRDLLSQATVEAQGDDFTAAGTRTQFSPRIGVSFPLTEQSQVFFNFGRYSQNPLYNNVYTNTGIGTVAGDALGVCAEDAVVPGTDQCYPIITNIWGETPFLGNPDLLIEKTTAYEMGYATELGGEYALQVAAFSKDQFGLTGTRQGGRSASGEQYFDVGSTYGNAIYNYFVLINQDFQTVRGFEVQLRRRLFNYWGFNVNFGFMQATTNASAPEREYERQANEGDPQNLKEVKSEIDIPVTLNASVFFRVANEDPFGNAILDAIVRNLSTTVTVQARSGFPYTPTLTFSGLGNNAQLERNTGRAPGIFNVDIMASKDFRLSNLQWGVFLRVSNLLDNVTCQSVYASTGNCDGGSIDQDRRRNGNTTTGGSTTLFDRADYYGPRRSFNFGARVSF
jgi:outer membrane receptor protein involved in Fe transport